jgi:hypothetical protein
MLPVPRTGLALLFADARRAVRTRARRSATSWWPHAIGDFTGDGHSDVVAFGNDQMYLFDGSTGRKVVPSGDAGAYGSYPLGFALPFGDVITTVVDTDGDGRPEIIGLNNSRTSRAARTEAPRGTAETWRGMRSDMRGTRNRKSKVRPSERGIGRALIAAGA